MQQRHNQFQNISIIPRRNPLPALCWGPHRRLLLQSWDHSCPPAPTKGPLLTWVCVGQDLGPAMKGKNHFKQLVLLSCLQGEALPAGPGSHASPLVLFGRRKRGEDLVRAVGQLRWVGFQKSPTLRDVGFTDIQICSMNHENTYTQKVRKGIAQQNRTVLTAGSFPCSGRTQSQVCPSLHSREGRLSRHGPKGKMRKVSH